MSTKKCPFCGEVIAAEAKKCRFCGEWLPQNEVSENLTQNAFVQEKEAAVAAENACARPSLTQNDVALPPSFFQAFFVEPFLRHYADFKGYASRKLFWMAVLSYLSISLGILGLALILFGTCGMAGMIIGIIISGIFSIATIIPQLALCCRRLRDAGKSPFMIFISLIPAVGSIILLIFLCKPSQQDEEASDIKVRISPVDWSIFAAEAVLLIAGIILAAAGPKQSDFDASPVEIVDDEFEYSDEEQSSDAETSNYDTFDRLTADMDLVFKCKFTEEDESRSMMIAFQPETGDGYYIAPSGNIYSLTIDGEDSTRSNFVCSAEALDGTPSKIMIYFGIQGDGQVISGTLLGTDGERTFSFTGYNIR